MMVSARVVNTHSLPSPIGPVVGDVVLKAKRTPVLLPIQLACISLTRSGQP
jgi:hypothetical protein